MAEETQSSFFDTDRQYLGDVYAKAALSLAQKKGGVDEMIGQLDSLVELLHKVPKLRSTLESPRIPFAAKESLIDKALKGKATPDFLNFVKVVCRKGRANCFGAIRQAARKMHDEMTGRVQATMTTAVAVSDDLQQKVGQKLNGVLGKIVDLTAKVDPSIIGGLVVQVGDTVYDGSVTNQLKQFRSSAIGRANQEIRQSLDRFAS